MGCGGSKEGASGPSISDNAKKEDKRIEQVGYPRLHPGGVVEIKSCNFGELDNLLVPLVQIHNKLATIHNGVYCSSLAVRGAASEALKLELVRRLVSNPPPLGHRPPCFPRARCARMPLTNPEDPRYPAQTGETKREVLPQGWRDDSIDYGGRAACQGEELCHYAGVCATLINGNGEALTDAQLTALYEKYEGLEALVGRLKECEAAINAIGETWKPLEPKGPFSLGVQPYGGVDELHVYRQPLHIPADKPIGMGVIMSLSKECFTGSVYFKEPPNSVKRAVSAFNKAAFSIRLKLASPKTLKQTVGEAVKWFEANGTPLTLDVKLNGVTISGRAMGALKSLAGQAKEEAKSTVEGVPGVIGDAKEEIKDDAQEAVEGAAEALVTGGDDGAEMAKDQIMAFMKKPKIPDALNPENLSITSLLPSSIRDLMDGECAITFELGGPGAEAIDSAPDEVKNVINAVVSSEDDANTLLNACSFGLATLSGMLKPDPEGAP